jgi:hypothetical protein
MATSQLVETLEGLNMRFPEPLAEASYFSCG